MLRAPHLHVVDNHMAIVAVHFLRQHCSCLKIKEQYYSLIEVLHCNTSSLKVQANNCTRLS